MNKKNIIILISLVGSLALIFVVLSPLWSSTKILRAELIERKDRMTQIEELLAKAQQIKQDYQDQELEEEAQKIFSALPEEEDLPRLLVQFDTLASNNGLLLESVKFGQIDQEQEKTSRQQPGQLSPQSSLFPSLSVDVKVSGSYDAFKGYLTALENNVRSMDVYLIKFGITKKGKEASVLTSLGIFEFDLGVNVYYQ